MFSGLFKDGRSNRSIRLGAITVAALVVSAGQAAAADRGVRRLLQMSSLGADEAGPSHYQRSKGRAERHVRAAPAGLDRLTVS